MVQPAQGQQVVYQTQQQVTYQQPQGKINIFSVLSSVTYA